MRSIFCVRYALFLLILTWIALGSLPARGDVLGTYKGGFVSEHQNVSVELRCDSNASCEIDATQSVDGAPLPAEPLMKWPLRPLGGCASPPQSEWGNCNVIDWDSVRKALKFAREHRGEQPIPEVQEMLKPLLESRADVERCYNVQQYAVVCEITQSPWGKPVVLYFSLMMQPCYPPSGFCTYRLMPLFKIGDAAIMRAKREGFVPEQRKEHPSSQAQVAGYVQNLQERIRNAMVVPSGAPSTARVTYQVQFNQETGNVYSVNFQDGCFCPSLRSAVQSAIRKIAPLPLLPKDQQSILGGRNGRIYLETVVGPTQ